MISNNETEFAHTCIDILKNPEKAAKIKNEALKFVRSKYDWKKINNNLNLMFK